MLEELFKKWVEHEAIIKGRRPYGIKKYVEDVQMFFDYLQRFNLPMEPENITRMHIEGFMKWLFYERKNLQNISRIVKLSAIRSFLKYLVYESVISSDPTEDIPYPRNVRPIPEKFTMDELARILTSPDMENTAGLRDSAVLHTLYGAGLRVSELTNLRLDDVIDTGYIRLKIVGSKRGRSRIVTLRSRPSEVLRQWITYRKAQGAGKNSPVFIRLKPYMERQISRQSINKILKKYAEKVGLGNAKVFVHKMRTTFATDLYDVGRSKCSYCGAPVEKIDIFEIMQLMGHSDPSTVMRYIAISEKILTKTAIPDRRWREIYDAAQKQIPSDGKKLLEGKPVADKEQTGIV